MGPARSTGATGTQLSNTLADEPLAYRAGIPSLVVMRPVLRCLKLEAAPVAGPAGSSSFVDRRDERCCIARKAFPAAQLQMEPSFTSSGKRRYPSLGSGGTLSPPGCFSFRRCLAAHSRRYGDLTGTGADDRGAGNAKLAVPSNPQDWLADERREYWHCCKVSDEAAFCLIQRPYISKTLLTRRISPRGSP
jgi:hypothetical protein